MLFHCFHCCVWFVCRLHIVLCSFVYCILFLCCLFVWFVLLSFFIVCMVLNRLYIVCMWFVCMVYMVLLFCALYFYRLYIVFMRFVCMVFFCFIVLIVVYCFLNIEYSVNAFCLSVVNCSIVCNCCDFNRDCIRFLWCSTVCIDLLYCLLFVVVYPDLCLMNFVWFVLFYCCYCCVCFKTLIVNCVFTRFVCRFVLFCGFYCCVLF